MAVNLIRTRTNDGFALSRPALAATARTGSARPVAPREPSGQDVTRRPSRSVEFRAHPGAAMDSAAITAALLGDVPILIRCLASAVGPVNRVAPALPRITCCSFETTRSIRHVPLSYDAPPHVVSFALHMCPCSTHVAHHRCSGRQHIAVRFPVQHCIHLSTGRRSPLRSLQHSMLPIIGVRAGSILLYASRCNIAYT